ncbi:MAG: patatin-like phospholipase family protein [Chlamydiia bacterium]|nr:patatin-like phospholipase family protein [Chlamydiia bacterium]
MIKKSFCLLLLLLASCKTGYFQRCQPTPIPEAVIIKEPIRVALVLGGGGARGMAHVGVIEELEMANIPIDLIVGCSAGGVVGTIYAANPNAKQLHEIFFQLKKNDVMSINIFNVRFGLVHGRELRQFLTKHLGTKDFADLKIPCKVVATDLDSGDLLSIGGGPVAPAVHASCAVPIVFRPVLLYGRPLVDGGVLNPIPVEIAHFENPKVIVAVDLSEGLPTTIPNHIFGIAKRCAEIAHTNNSKRCIQGADIVIRPELGSTGLFDDRFKNHHYEAGKEAARQAIPLILSRLSS